MNNCFVYCTKNNDENNINPKDYNIPSNSIILGSFNNMCKVSKELRYVWYNILQKTENTVLFLLNYPSFDKV